MFGLFSKKGKCSICSKETSKQLKDGYICNDCLVKCGNNLNRTLSLKEMNVSDIKEAIEKAKQDMIDMNNFNTTRKVGKYISFDDNQRKFLLPKTFFTNAKIYDYSELLGYELLEDGDIITKGGLGRAVVGGVLFGGVGAIVGGVTGGKRGKRVIKSVKIKLTLDNKAVPVEYVTLLNSEFKSDSFVYKSVIQDAEKIIGILTSISRESENKSLENTSVSELSGADEILKFKKLLDEGIITEEEFAAKKKQILGL